MIRRWRRRPGLAGGIDKDGGRAAELLGLGFASVEFGTVTPYPDAPGQPCIAALVARLAALGPRPPEAAAIGVGLGLRTGGTPQMLADDWRTGLAMAYGVADYLSFNLSARAYRPLLAAAQLPRLVRALAGVAAERRHLAAATGRRVALALKLPLGPASAAGTAWAIAEAAAAAGFDAVTAVLPDGEARLPALVELARRLRGQTALLAVGGMRGAADVRAALAAGADGIQVHTAFVEQGPACLPALLAGFGAARDGEGEGDAGGDTTIS